MAEPSNNEEQGAYPSQVDPRLLAANEVRQNTDSLDVEDSVLKGDEHDEHIGFIRKVLGIVAA